MSAKQEINAREIIERFGGIRPMAKKLEVAVTTVQGWKKRNAIPAARMPQIQKAATKYDIDLTGSKETVQTPAENDNVQLSADNPIGRAANASESVQENGVGSTHEIQYIQATGMSGRTMFIFLIVIVAFLVAGLMTMAPKVKVVSEQADRITELERELKTVQKEQSLINSVVPNDLQNKLKIIEQKAQTAKVKAQEIAQDTKNAVDVIKAGSVEERLELIEGQIGTYIDEKTSLNLSGVWHNIQALRGTKEGNTKLAETNGDLLSWLNRLQSDEVTVEEALPVIVDESPLIGEAIGNVEKENLKAAAMLLAMSQMRDTLSRDNQSFEQDLELLKKLVGDENPALSASIETLAPHAQKGVLTPGGLSTQFKKLAGDVVVASLSGEDVSISEKAKSRFGEILVVEKDGKQITGTETQRAVADAQKLIDGGDIQGTIQVLQNLDGDALKTVQPFLREAKLSLLASQVQQLLGDSIQSKIRVSTMSTPSAAENIKSLNIQDIGVENVIDDIKEAVPLGGQLYEDPESGFKIFKKN